MKFELFNGTIDIQKNLIENKELPEDLQVAIKTILKYGKEIQPSGKKIESAKNASKIKETTAKRKVQDSINLLLLMGEKITPYKVAKQANISYNTAKKYLSRINYKYTK